jgi:hypothetical protein
MRQCLGPISAERLSVAGILGLTPASLLDRGRFCRTAAQSPMRVFLLKQSRNLLPLLFHHFWHAGPIGEA